VDYAFSFTNPGGGWATQLGFDEQGLPALYLIFFFFYLGLVVAHVYAIIQLRRMESYHPIIQLLTGSLAASFLAVFLNLIHWGSYAANGVGAPGIKGLADLLDFGNDLILTVLIVLVAHGWTITTTVLKPRDRTAVVVLLCVLVLVYLTLFIWDYAAPTPASTLYFYQSVPGYLLLAVRILCLGWFVFCMYQTLQLETAPEKRRFYFIFGGAYGAWLLTMPIIVLIAAVVDPWVMLKTVTVVQVLIDYLSLVALVALMWPTWARRYFIIAPGRSLLAAEGEASPSAAGTHQDL